MRWLFLVLAIALEVTATLSLRASEGFSRLGFSLLVVAGYTGSFLALNLVLTRGVPVGVAYGIWAATGVAAVAVLGKLLFDDPLTPLMGMGIVLIIGGVLLVEVGGTRAAE
ncbi:SMR family transporter [Rhodococcus sp. X156]|uniref:DMT family transporter n=1 Tax=Rhodococcus sp. X156 TaxID=2499145 RepID=UPI000FDCA2E3|nr:SMR family transporter [Rhodococcus sp. X156]